MSSPEHSSFGEQQPGYTERSPQEQLEHLNDLMELIQETGFIETAEMEILRKTDLTLWVKKAQDIIDTAKGNDQLHRKLFLGYLIAIATIHYETRNADLYFEYIDQAQDIARYTGLTEFADKLEALG